MVSLSAQGTGTVERRLSNGMRVLLVERANGGMVHAALFTRGGRADTGILPPVSAELLTRSLFGPCTAADLSGTLEELVNQEERSYESLRRELLQQQRATHGIPATPEVAALQAGILGRLREALLPSGNLDLFEQLGVTSRHAGATADFLFTDCDLPSAQLTAWSKLEAQRLAAMRLYRVPLEREKWLGALPFARPQDPGLSSLLGTAFVGHPYASALDENASAIAGLSCSDLKPLATRLLTPDRLLLVLVGEVSFEAVTLALEASFGRLPGTPEPDSFPVEAGTQEGALRLESSAPKLSRFYLGWRIPPATHPDTEALRLVAQVLGNCSSSRLQALVSRGLARSVSASLGVPGDRGPNLFLLRSEPEEGHSLAELEIAIRGEVLRLQENPLPPGEFQKVLRLAELDRLTSEDDPLTLAVALGRAWASLGDWRQAFPSTKRQVDIRPEDIQRAARLHLSLDRAVVGLVEPDRGKSEDPLDRQLATALRRLAKQKGVEPAKAETLVQEGMRQLRMLPREQRAATLKLLVLPTKEAP